jgi:hypothetical protein
VESSLKNKKVGVYAFDVSLTKKKQKTNTDSVCFCNGQAASESMTPYLINAGLQVTNMFNNQRVTLEKAIQQADSLQLDYILVGNGIIDMQGKSSFMESLNIKLINVQSKQSHMVASFTGVAIRPAKAGMKIGKKIQKKLN